MPHLWYHMEKQKFTIKRNIFLPLGIFHSLRSKEFLPSQRTKRLIFSNREGKLKGVKLILYLFLLPCFSFLLIRKKYWFLKVKAVFWGWRKHNQTKAKKLHPYSRRWLRKMWVTFSVRGWSIGLNMPAGSALPNTDQTFGKRVFPHIPVCVWFLTKDVAIINPVLTAAWMNCVGYFEIPWRGLHDSVLAPNYVSLK